MKPQTTRTAQEIREEWLYQGMGQNEWARMHGFNPATVSQVLSGKNTGARGVGHKVAVALGIKNGVVKD